jgi:hypothetical protein
MILDVLILGGAPAANWTPFLLPLIGIFLVIGGLNLLIGIAKKRGWGRRHHR